MAPNPPPPLRRKKATIRPRADGDETPDRQSNATNLDGRSPSSASLSADAKERRNHKPTASPARKQAAATGSSSGSRDDKSLTSTAKTLTEADVMLSGMSLSDPRQAEPMPAATDDKIGDIVLSPPKSPNGPVIVSSSSAKAPTTHDTHRIDIDAAQQRGNETDAAAAAAAFVPNRGSFFMHDQRRGGPAAGTAAPRPYGRGRGRGTFFRGGNGAAYPPSYGGQAGNHNFAANDHAMNRPWAHDMHDAGPDPSSPSRRPRYIPDDEGPANGNGVIPTCKESQVPINRTLSTERHVGNAQVRVFLPNMGEAKIFSGVLVKQYTKLPDHRPPLRRDKPVRISLPDRTPRYVYPASDRSFTFIPRALRPNQQQRLRGKPRSAWGSVGGYSRKTSVFGGSYYGSVYTPSINLSRRSSVAGDREHMFSPTLPIMSRPPMAMECMRPGARLPQAQQQPGMLDQNGMEIPFHPAQFGDPRQGQTPSHYANSIVSDSQASTLPMHQPKPQKNISVANIEPGPMALPTSSTPGFQQAFHHQMPLQMGNGGMQDGHGRRASHSSQRASGTTPLSHIPERNAHGSSFHPSPAAYNMSQQQQQQPQQPQQQQQYYNAMQPQPYHHQQHQQPLYSYQPDFYYQSGYSTTHVMPQYTGTHDGSGMSGAYVQQTQGGHPAAVQNPGLLAQEMNGMVYYYDPNMMQQQQPQQHQQQQHMATQMPMPGYGQYQNHASTPPGMMYYSQ
ncbi:hypothetical protein VHEMI08223 [[Torrubiella] hemipterigena]|uniref:Btz domain-containing protein n=1 Tax=[Torrubiella] hemipterigena TaxID=1531966 RepID=A0A0A1TCR1_9HYPO|nr:hypothetical protein VHEMI08223 [[Torrubiella] hemipterigena]